MPVVAEGRWCGLRPLTAEDLPFLHSLDSNGDGFVHGRLRGRTMLPDQYARHLSNDVLCQFIAVRRGTEQRIGHVVASGANFLDRHVEVSVAVVPAVVGAGWPMEAAVLFVEFLFAQFPFERLRFLVLSSGTGTLARGLDDVLHLEARLREHQFVDGRFADTRLYALDRETWVEHRSLFLRSATPTDV